MSPVFRHLALATSLLLVSAGLTFGQDRAALLARFTYDPGRTDAEDGRRA